METSFELFDATPASLMTLMVSRLRLLGEATVTDWEQDVFHAVTGRTRAELDWDYSPNEVGYAIWLRAFGQLAAALLARGEVHTETRDGQTVVVPRLVGPLS